MKRALPMEAAVHTRAARTALLLALLLLPQRALSQVSDSPGSTASARHDSGAGSWRGDVTRLFVAPSGRTLERREVVVGVYGTRADPIVFAAAGLTRRLSFEAGYSFQRSADVQDGAAIVGADLQLGSRTAPLAVQLRADLPMSHDLGRRLGDVSLIGVRQWGNTRNAFVAGGGWRGSRSLCHADWEGCRSEWEGSWYGVAGGYVSVTDHVQIVSENTIRILSIGTVTGARVAIRGFTAGVGVACGGSVLFGFGVRCGDLHLNASYRFSVGRAQPP